MGNGVISKNGGTTVVKTGAGENQTTKDANNVKDVKVVKDVKEMENWGKVLHEVFPGSVREEDFVTESYKALNKFGFESRNTLSCVSVCRDEMCLPFVDLVDQKWKYPFHTVSNTSADANQETQRTIYTHCFCMSSLAGMLFLGKTGLGAAISHATRDPKDGRRRYVFLAMPHIGITSNGTLGEVERPGFTLNSHACGALMKFKDELTAGFVDTETVPDDIEYTIMKQRLFKKLRVYGDKVPPVQEITEQTFHVILEDLEKLIELAVDKKTCDYAVLAGIMVHVPEGLTFIQPKMMYAVLNGEKKAVEILGTKL